MGSKRWLLCLLALLSACSGQPATRAPMVHFSLAADPASLDPLFITPDAASVEQQVARLSFLPFLDLDARGAPVPVLLARVPTVANGDISPDGRTLAFHLRAGVRWSDGVPVTSADVLFTLHAILDPKNPVQSTEGYRLIDRATARGPLVVVMHLQRPWAPAATTFFSYGDQAQFVLPAHRLAREANLSRSDFDNDPDVVDGPYRLVSYRRGDRMEYVPNARYFGAHAGMPDLDVRIVGDPSTNMVMLESGALDWNLIAPSQRVALQSNRDIGFTKTPTAVVAALVFNTKHAPLDDVRVRRAIAMSIDRASISRTITLGAYPVTNMLQPQFSWAYDPSVTQPGFDPAGADALLDAAGWKRGADGIRARGGHALRLTYVQFPESMTGVRVAATVQAELRERGIDASIKSVSNEQLFLPHDGVLARGLFDIAYVPYTLGSDPDDAFVLSCDGVSNYMGWCNAQVDALENRALATPDQRIRKGMYARIARIVAEQVPLLYLFNAQYVYAHRSRLRGFAPNAFLPTWNATSWKI